MGFFRNIDGSDIAWIIICIGIAGSMIGAGRWFVTPKPEVKTIYHCENVDQRIREHFFERCASGIGRNHSTCVEPFERTHCIREVVIVNPDGTQQRVVHEPATMTKAD